MKIQSLFLFPYKNQLVNGTTRFGNLIKIVSDDACVAWGDVAPLPGRSQETLEESVLQLNRKKDEIIKIDWSLSTCLQELVTLDLLPSVLFGLESALLSVLAPVPKITIPVSAFLAGSPKEILKTADQRYSEGYASAKLKVSRLSFFDAANIIRKLKKMFYLRIDVNKAWNTSESLKFFSQFGLDDFDYVEEPFQDPSELAKFTHPIAIDESFPSDLSLSQLESLPNLKALIYKPTIQGGMLNCLALRQWAVNRGISLILSSSFESYIGHAHVACMAERMQLSAPMGIGTYHYLKGWSCSTTH